jgi:uncharacterized protein (DUF2252 family)
MRDPLDEFRTFNRPFARRNPELMRHKIARMSDSAFAFFRGTFHLFARDVLSGTLAPMPTTGATELGIVGDIHSENYGTFKAEDSKVHYDINDFDETTTGRFDFDIIRLAISLFLASRDRGDPLDAAVGVAMSSVTHYTTRLPRILSKKAPEPDVSESAPTGCLPLDALVQISTAAKRPAFIERITQRKGKSRLLIRSPRYYNLPDAERGQAVRLLADYRANQKHLPDKEDSFAVEDVCGRVSGIGSMGRYRYVLLLAGKGSAEARNLLLEFKEARPSAYDLYRHRDDDDAALVHRAEHVIGMQRLSQAASNRYLGCARDGGMSFQVRQLGAADARLETKPLERHALDDLGRIQMGILARVHARSAGRSVGPSNPLAELADPEAFCQRVISLVLGYADIVHADYRRFVGARADLDRVEEWMA